MKLKDGCGNVRSDRTEESLIENILLLRAVSDKQDLLSLHNRSHTHGDSLGRDNALQIYCSVEKNGFDVAKESYLKLFTYTDENSEMTTEEVLLYAGLTSYVDEATFTLIQSSLGR